MKPSKNLRDRLANQSGMPISGGATGGGRSDGGLNKLIEAERTKRRDAAAGVDGADLVKNKPNTSVPSRLAGAQGRAGRGTRREQVDDESGIALIAGEP